MVGLPNWTHVQQLLDGVEVNFVGTIGFTREQDEDGKDADADCCDGIMKLHFLFLEENLGIAFYYSTLLCLISVYMLISLYQKQYLKATIYIILGAKHRRMCYLPMIRFGKFWFVLGKIDEASNSVELHFSTYTLPPPKVSLFALQRRLTLYRPDSA